MAEISEIRQTVVKEAGGGTEVDLSQHRVFLLGENRWEEPSRLAGRDRKDVRNEYAATKCLTCRGEGRLLCTGILIYRLREIFDHFLSLITYRYDHFGIGRTKRKSSHILYMFSST